MAKRSFSKKPLYRRVNRCTHGVSRNGGGEHRWHRNTKAEVREIQDGVTRRGMRQSVHAGLDYTPLFRFLLSKIGEDWDVIYREAVSRLPENSDWQRDEPIYWIVARDQKDASPTIRVDEASYFSGLYVNAENRLENVAPDISAENFFPFCPCCTHTYNGVRVTTEFDPDRIGETRNE